MSFISCRIDDIPRKYLRVTNMKKHIITALIILAIIVSVACFGGLLVASKIQASHAVSGVSQVNVYGVYFLCVAMTGFASMLSYFTINIRYS